VLGHIDLLIAEERAAEREQPGGVILFEGL
jgi:hypothetical protein